LFAFTPPSVAADGGEEPIRFDYAAPRECPTTEQVLDQIRSFTTRWTLAPPEAETRRFVVRITRAGQHYTGRLDLHSVLDSDLRRELRGERCEDVVAGLAVAVALAIDPNALGAPSSEPERVADAEPSPLPASPLPIAEHDTAPPRKPAPPRPPAKPETHTVVATGARMDANGAVSGVLPTIVAWVEIAWRAPTEGAPYFAVRPVLRAGLRQSFSRTATVGESSVDIGFRTGFVEACPTRLALPWRFSLDGCFAFDVGQLWAEARNVPAAYDARRLWLDAGVVLDLRWQAHRHLFVELAAGAWYPILRDRIRVEPDGVISRAPPLGASVGVGAGYVF